MAKNFTTSVRLSDEAAKLLKAMARDKGLSQAAIMELAIRALAEQEGYRE